MLKNVLLIFILFLFPFKLFALNSSEVFQEIRRTPALQEELKAWVAYSIAETYQQKIEKPVLAALFQERLPVFITIKKQQITLGCVGSLQAKQENFAQEILANLRLAFTRDPRHLSIPKSQAKDLQIFISTVTKKERVQSLGEISLANDGVLLKQGNREAVALPGEAKTKRYLLAFLKAKAGLRKERPYQLYRLRVETLSTFYQGDEQRAH